MTASAPPRLLGISGSLRQTSFSTAILSSLAAMVKAINRALEGVTCTTAIYLCFGYAHRLCGKPNGYTFLLERANKTSDQISIEAVQPQLNLGMLGDLATKTVILGGVNLGDCTIEVPETVAERIQDGLRFLPPEQLVAALTARGTTSLAKLPLKSSRP